MQRTSTDVQTSERARKPPCNWVGQKEKRESKELGQGLHSREGAVEERFLHPGKSPHGQGDQPGWSGHQSLRGECSNQFAGGKMESDLQGSGYHHPTLPSLRRPSAGVGRGWVLKLRLQRSDPGKGSRLAAWRQHDEAGVWQLSMHKKEAWARQRGKAPLLGGTRGEGRDRHRSFFPCMQSQATGQNIHEL